MFTGLVVDQGRVRRAQTKRQVMDLEIEAPSVARSLDEGDSVAVNGVCLTATEASRRRFSAQVVPETLAVATLGDLSRGDAVNLELAAKPTDRLGGHFVQGHVDGIASVVRSEDDDAARRLWWALDEELLRYVVPKGSIAIDGVSLTVVESGHTSFQVALIPHTLDATTLGTARVGTRANVEVDVIAKYVERLTAAHRSHRD